MPKQRQKIMMFSRTAALALLLGAFASSPASAAPPPGKKPDKDKADARGTGAPRGPNRISAGSCKGNGRKCDVDMSAFNVTAPPDTALQVDLGHGRNYACKTKAKRGQGAKGAGEEKGNKARGASLYAECEGGGTLNAIERKGKVYASTSMGEEVCQLRPGVVDCTPLSEMPPDGPQEGSDTLHEEIEVEEIELAEDFGPSSNSSSFCCRRNSR